MATLTWTSASSTDFTLNTNYTPNGTPANGDTIRVPSGASILTNVGTALTTMTFETMEEYANQIGAVGAPLTFASTTALKVRSPKMQGFYFSAGTATQINVSACGGAGFVLSAGTVTEMNTSALTTITGGTLTTLRIAGPGTVANIGSGATITALRALHGASVVCAAVPTNIYIENATVVLTSTASSTYTLIEVHGVAGALFSRGSGQTYTLIYNYGGVVDIRRSWNHTITNYTADAGTTNYLDNGATSNTFSNSPKDYGASLIQVPSNVNVSKQFTVGGGVGGGGYA